MATETGREQEKKMNRKKSGSSDRSRIKNITNEVHPEYTASKRRVVREEERGRQSREQKTQMTDARRRQMRAERREKIRRRRRRRQMFRMLAACLIIGAFVMTGMVVKNYNSGSRHDNKGMNAYESGDYDTAVSEFKEALSYDGQNSDYYIHLGMAYIEKKSYDEALGYFNQAEGCAEDDNQKALLNRGRGIASLYRGDYTGAVEWFEDALAASEQSKDVRVDTLYYKAEAEEKSGNYTAAVQSYGQVIDLTDDAGARMLRGMAYMALQDYSNAEKDLYTAIDRSRKSYSIYRALYGALEAQGKTDEAKSVLNDALELSGSSGEDYFNRGMIYIDLQDNASAVEMLEKSYDKGYKAALLGLGESSIRQKDYEKARGYYETFFSEADADGADATLAARGYNQYAVCLMAGGDYEKAAEACENGLQYNDRNVDASLSLNLISAYEHLGRWEDAYNVAKAYADKYPEDEKGMKEFYFLESRVAQ